MYLENMNKIVLGAAQFGLDYGINNKRGKIPEKDAYRILNKSVYFGINTVDTARQYGESENVIGNFLKLTGHKFKIISKLPDCKYDEVKGIFRHSLNELGLEKIYAYLIHNFKSYRKEVLIWDEIKKLKNDGKIEKAGFSLYYPQELEYLLKHKVDFDMVQVPYSIFDQRFENYFLELKQRNIDVYVRSVFLQGLLFKKPDSLANRFYKIKNKIIFLLDTSKKIKAPISLLCLGFVLFNKNIDKVIFGVDKEEDLIENLTQLKKLDKIHQVYESLKALREDDENIILPFKWK
jgi:aryl-alcohol dehydrogenase-like predicted oxidoreductase